jgi:CheY-like chemotaxis protein
MHHPRTFDPQSDTPAPACADPTFSPAASNRSAGTPAIALPPRPSALEFDPAAPPILIADDDTDDTYFIRHILKRTGVKNPVVAFDDGTELVNYLGSLSRLQASGRRRQPLLLFLDLNMAGLGGFGFLEWARKQENLPLLKIVILSHSNSSEDMARARELGAHRYLVKYPSVQTFSTIVRSVYPQTVF